SASQPYPEITDDATTAGVYTHLCSPDVLAAMSQDAQGVLAVARPGPASAEDLLAADPQPRLLATLAQVRDPGNAGTVIRAADAAGAAGVLLSAGSVDVHNPKVVRSTAGSLFHLPVATDVDLAEVARTARDRGLQVFAADGGGAADLYQADLTRPTLWLFGNEAHGLGTAERELADAVVRIPIHGRAESLNLAMAATVCLSSAGLEQHAGRRGQDPRNGLQLPDRPKEVSASRMCGGASRNIGVSSSQPRSFTCRAHPSCAAPTGSEVSSPGLPSPTRDRWYIQIVPSSSVCEKVASNAARSAGRASWHSAY